MGSVIVPTQKGERQEDDEEPKPKPLPACTKVRTWMPGEKVDLVIGESGIEAEEPMTVGQLFKDAVARFQMHPALKYKEDGIGRPLPTLNTMVFVSRLPSHS